MAPTKKAPAKNTGIEFHPDPWKPFKRAAGVVAKSPPQHRAAKKKKTKTKRVKKDR
jgi:hypothetical protein